MAGAGGSDGGGGDRTTGFFGQTVNPEPTKKEKARERAIGFVNDAVDESRGLQSAATDTIRGDLQPFASAGVSAVGDLQSNLANVQNLINDPNAQKDFVTKNPFFELLKKDATDALFNNKGARGKLGSGGTASALQNAFALLGTDLVDQNVRQNLSLGNSQLGVAQLGENAAVHQGNFTQQGTTNITDLITSGGQANASNILGQERDRNQSRANSRDNLTNLVGLGISALSLSDRNFKENIRFIGMNKSTPLYFFNYKGSAKLELGTMAQEVPHAAINIGGKLYVDYARL